MKLCVYVQPNPELGQVVLSPAIDFSDNDSNTIVSPLVNPVIVVKELQLVVGVPILIKDPPFTLYSI